MDLKVSSEWWLKLGKSSLMRWISDLVLDAYLSFGILNGFCLFTLRDSSELELPQLEVDLSESELIIRFDFCLPAMDKS